MLDLHGTVNEMKQVLEVLVGSNNANIPTSKPLISTSSLLTSTSSVASTAILNSMSPVASTLPVSSTPLQGCDNFDTTPSPYFYCRT